MFIRGFQTDDCVEWSRFCEFDMPTVSLANWCDVKFVRLRMGSSTVNLTLPNPNVYIDL